MIEIEERLLVCAPVGRDARLTRDLLGKAKIGCEVCEDLDEMIRRLESEGAAAVLLAEETLTPSGHCTCDSRPLDGRN